MSPAKWHLPNRQATDRLLAAFGPAVVTPMLILSASLVLLLLLLAVPLDLVFSIERVRNFQGKISVRWLFGVVRFRIPLPSTSGQQRKAEHLQQSSKKRAARNKHRARPDFVAVIGQTQFRRRVYRFLKDLVRALHLQRLRLLMRWGLGDPADTGRLWALIGPLSAMVQNVRSAEVCIEPEFMDAVLEVQADGQLRLIPLQLLVVVFAFVLSPPSIRAWRTLRASPA